MKLKISILVLTAVAGCGALLALKTHRTTASASIPAAPKLTYQVHGIVRAISRTSVRVAHEAIPNYMPAMTMDFPVKDSIPKGLAAGDQVQFELSVTSDDSWISHITTIRPEISPGAVTQAPTSAEASTEELQKGEAVPDFDLIDQNGKAIRLSDFRGKPLVLTFIYTRCPLPNFCPLMSKNFQALQQRLEKEYPGRFQLLSISIDPKFDRPEVLKEYAARYQANEQSWNFATGSLEQIDAIANEFGLVHEPESGLISHNLRTALIAADGRLRHVWKSNVWTPYEVDRMIGETLAEPKTYSAAGHL